MSYHPSHVIYLCKTLINSFHGSGNEAGLYPFPFMTSSSPKCTNREVALYIKVCISNHFSPYVERPITYDKTSSFTYICLPFTIIIPFLKFLVNSKGTSLSNPCSCKKYYDHLTWYRVLCYFLDIHNWICSLHIEWMSILVVP